MFLQLQADGEEPHSQMREIKLKRKYREKKTRMEEKMKPNCHQNKTNIKAETLEAKRHCVTI